VFQASATEEDKMVHSYFNAMIIVYNIANNPEGIKQE